MLDGAMLVWFALTAGSVFFVVLDSVVNGVTSWVQRTAWILVTAFTGPVGAFFYLPACRRPVPGGVRPDQRLGCHGRYLSALAFGLFIFQALMMVGMYEGDYWKAVRKTFFAETVSMNLVMTGMLPVMLILGTHWAGSEQPQHASFWCRMSLATIVGGIVAYPINHWLVANRLEHGCMTLPGADAPAPGLGHTSPEPSMVMDHTQMQHASEGEPGHAMTELSVAARP